MMRDSLPTEKLPTKKIRLYSKTTRLRPHYPTLANNTSSCFTRALHAVGVGSSTKFSSITNQTDTKNKKMSAEFSGLSSDPSPLRLSKHQTADTLLLKYSGKGNLFTFPQSSYSFPSKQAFCSNSSFQHRNRLCGTMYTGGYTAEVTSLSPKATEHDVYDFFSHCGAVEHVEILRSGDYACTAYVTFRDAFALETAILLSGAEILDQCVFISQWGTYIDESDTWNSHSQMTEDNTSLMVTEIMRSVYTPGEAVTMAQQVVKTMLSKGYVLTKDALVKAKAFDDSCQVSATAAAKVSELSNRIGLTETIHAGMETVKYIDQKLHVSDITRSAAAVTGTAAVVAVTVTGKAAMAAGNAVVNSSYFSKGALWVSDMLSRAAKAAAEVGKNSSK